MKRRAQNGHQPTSPLTAAEVRRDETTILPPTH